MKKEAFALLLGYIINQEKEIDKLLGVISSTDALNNEKTVYLGYYLHNIYSAFEDIFKETTKIFENKIEDISKYHRELLKRMAFEIPGIRPSVLSTISLEILDELRSFRHVFRHSYMSEINHERVQSIKERLLQNIDMIKNDIEKFKQFLKDKIQED